MSLSPDALATLAAGFDSPRLRIAPVDEDQAAAMLAWLMGPQVYTWISLKPPPDLAALQARLAARAPNCALAERELQLAWSVQRRSDGAWIGALDANLSLSGVATNVGYFFGVPYWGQGLASEAVAALCAHLDAHGVTEQHACVTVGNDASCLVPRAACSSAAVSDASACCPATTRCAASWWTIGRSAAVAGSPADWV